MMPRTQSHTFPGSRPEAPPPSGGGAGGGPPHLVPVLHDVAGVGVGLHQLVLLVEGLSGQILLQRGNHGSPLTIRADGWASAVQPDPWGLTTSESSIQLTLYQSPRYVDLFSS